MIFFCFGFPVVLFGSPWIANVTQHVVSVESSSLLFHSIKSCLFVYCDDSLTSKSVIMRTEQPTKCFVPLQVGSVKLVKGPHRLAICSLCNLIICKLSCFPFWFPVIAYMLLATGEWLWKFHDWRQTSLYIHM